MPSSVDIGGNITLTTAEVTQRYFLNCLKKGCGSVKSRLLP